MNQVKRESRKLIGPEPSNSFDSKVHIKFGDFFQQQGWKAVGVNDFFDSEVDDDLVAINSLHGKRESRKLIGPEPRLVLWLADTAQAKNMVGKPLHAIHAFMIRGHEDGPRGG